MSVTVDSSPSMPTLKVEPGRRLNVGCGANPMARDEGWVNADYKPGKCVDHVFDANGPWPYRDETFIQVNSSHVLEHLKDYMNYFRETWRVLKPNGTMTIQVPYGWSSACWWDVTHLRPWLQESFAGLQPGFIKFTRNLQHEDIGCAFWIHQIIIVLQKDWARLWRFRPLRPIVKWAMKHLLNVIQDLFVEAVKTERNDPRSKAWGGQYHPAIVPCNIGVFESQYYGRNGAESDRLIVFEMAHETISGNGQ